jgi:DNA polymerase III sliding clamp (beta) subunit (PCNA family)
MQATIPCNVLADTLAGVRKLLTPHTPSFPNNQPMARITVDAENGHTTLSGVNDSAVVHRQVDFHDPIASGTCTVTGKDFADAIKAIKPNVRKSDDPLITMSLDGDTLTLTNGDLNLTIDATDYHEGVRKYRPRTLPAIDDPTHPAGPLAPDRVMLSARDFDRAIRQTMEATDTTNTRYAIGCLSLDLQPDSVGTGRVVATTGSLLHVATVPTVAEGKGLDVPKVLPYWLAPRLPLSACKAILATLDPKKRGDEVVSVWASEPDPQNQRTLTIAIGKDRARFVIDAQPKGRFPMWMDCMPYSYTTRWVGIAGELKTKIKRLTGLLDPSDTWGMDLDINRDSLTLAVKSDRFGGVSDTVGGSCETPCHPTDGVRVYAANLATTLDAFAPSDRVILEFDGEKTPLLISDENRRFRALLMCMPSRHESRINPLATSGATQ